MNLIRVKHRPIYPCASVLPEGSHGAREPKCQKVHLVPEALTVPMGSRGCAGMLPARRMAWYRTFIMSQVATVYLADMDRGRYMEANGAGQ